MTVVSTRGRRTRRWIKARGRRSTQGGGRQRMKDYKVEGRQRKTKYQVEYRQSKKKHKREESQTITMPWKQKKMFTWFRRSKLTRGGPSLLGWKSSTVVAALFCSSLLKKMGGRPMAVATSA